MGLRRFLVACHCRSGAVLGAGLGLALLASLGACDRKSEARQPAPTPTPPAQTAAVAASAPGAGGGSLVGLPGIDLAGLDEGQQRWLHELLDKYPSPCGKAHSLYTSLKTDPKCKRSVFAGRYLVTLLKAGFVKSEVEEHYEDRFVSPTMANIDISDAPVRGNPSAPITIVEFADFECPHCKLFEGAIQRILAEDHDQVKLVFKNYPISKLHPEAADAAAAAVAAGYQGKFWQMHDKLFENQEHLAPADLEKYATELKLDVKKWKADLPKAAERVERDHAEGERLEISGTPSIYIQGRKYAGPLRYEEVKDWVDEEQNK